MEQITFHPYIKDILKPLEDINSYKFINGVKTVLAYLAGATVIEEKKVLIETDRDLFQSLKDLSLDIYGMIVFKTSKGSIYLWDKESNASLRFMNKGSSYQVMNASKKCFFKGEDSDRILDTPHVGLLPTEIVSYDGEHMTYHNGHKIIDLAE